MDLILWIIFGALAGWVASMLMGTGGGLLWDIVVGIVGAVIGGFIMNLLGQSGGGGFSIYSFAVAVLGACVLIAIVRALRRS
ncbi:MAG: GlsB/YeaQ/YmgE family stress response membrane protein [Patescibacteria group bacterium]